MNEFKHIPLPFTPNNNSTTTVVPYDGYAVLGGSANDVLGVFYIPYKCEVRMCGLYVTETFACDTTEPVFYFDEAAVGTIPTEDGDLAIISPADGLAAGKVAYQKPATLATPARVTLEPGKWVVVSLQTDAADSGTVAGKVMPFLVVDMIPENEANQSAFVEYES